MDIHKNARTTPHSRAELVRRVLEEGQTQTAVAAAFGVSMKTVRTWVDRFQAEGPAGLLDRSSRPHKLRDPTPEAVVAQIEALRRQRFTGKQIACDTGVSPATVSRVLRRLGLSRLRDLDPAQPVRRYERQRPGELIHIDIKKLGRFERVGHRITGDRTRQSNRRGTKLGGMGWEYVHVCIDDASRVAFSQIKPDEKKGSAVDFLKAAVAYYASLGITVERVMTDNGSCYKAFDFRVACAQLGLRHIRTKPYTPKTNGKAERFIQTALREWAYAKAYPTSDQRGAELHAWLHRYNWHRPHGSLKANTPISRLALPENNLLMLHIYAKRWSIECGFRDTKDLRYGMGMGSVRVSTPQRRDRLWLLNAFAIALLTLLGTAGEALGYDRHLKSNTAKRRTHSLFRQGCMLYELIPNMPDIRLRPLIERYAALLREQPVFADLFGSI